MEKSCHLGRHLTDFVASVSLLRHDNEWHLQLDSVVYLGAVCSFGMPWCVPPGLQLLQGGSGDAGAQHLPTPRGYHPPRLLMRSQDLSQGPFPVCRGTGALSIELMS